MALSVEDLKLKLVEGDILIDRYSFEELWEVDGNKVYGLTITASDAITTWEKLYKLVTDTGYYPVILGDRAEAIQTHSDEIEQRSSHIIVKKLLEEAEDIDSNKWFVSEAREMREDSEDDEDCWIEGEEFPDDRNEIDRDILEEIDYWHETFEKEPEYTIPSSDQTLISLLPTTTSWETFAFLQFGGWNDCPTSEENIAIAKRWYELYGAEVVGISNDTVEMRVGKPPLDADAAFRLAQEQYIYCKDIVNQGVGSLTKLAVNLYANNIWFFWWD
jgi:Domain of unknown function (DUF4253)